MRPLASWLQDPYAASGDGWLHPADDRFAARLDRRKTFDGEPVDCGWVGEDADGIWCTRDPYCAALEDRTVWGVLLAVWSGDVEITRRDREELAACDFTLKAHAAAAVDRWRAERIQSDAAQGADPAGHR